MPPKFRISITNEEYAKIYHYVTFLEAVLDEAKLAMPGVPSLGFIKAGAEEWESLVNRVTAMQENLDKHGEVEPNRKPGRA